MNICDYNIYIYAVSDIFIHTSNNNNDILWGFIYNAPQAKQKNMQSNIRDEIIDPRFKLINKNNGDGDSEDNCEFINTFDKNKCERTDAINDPRMWFTIYNAMIKSTTTSILSFYTANIKLLKYKCNTCNCSDASDQLKIEKIDTSQSAYFIDFVMNTSDGFSILNANIAQPVLMGVINDPTNIPCKFLIITFYGCVLSYNTNSLFNSFNLVINNNITKSVYTGIEQVDDLLYLVDFNNAQIQVYDKNYNLVSNSGFYQFVDPQSMQNPDYDFAPFNIKCINEYMFVTYTKYVQYSSIYYGDIICTAGDNIGYTNVFTKLGLYVGTLQTQDVNFSAPWGITTLPAYKYECVGSDNSKLSNKMILIGNCGNGKINIFSYEIETNTNTGQIIFTSKFICELYSKTGSIQIPGLKKLSTYDDIIYFSKTETNSTEGLDAAIGIIFECGKKICIKIDHNRS